jgi:hypothetical protein
MVAPGRIPLVDTNHSNRSNTPDSLDELYDIAENETETPSTSRNQKTSFEANPDVQRWLREQEAERAGTKPPFNPTFLAHQRDRPWVLSSLATFYEDDLISDVLAVVKSGKEATVYCCAVHPSTGLDYVAAKVYRPRMFRSLRNDAVYRASRPQFDARGREGRGARRWRMGMASSAARTAADTATPAAGSSAVLWMGAMRASVASWMERWRRWLLARLVATRKSQARGCS